MQLPLSSKKQKKPTSPTPAAAEGTHTTSGLASDLTSDFAAGALPPHALDARRIQTAPARLTSNDVLTLQRSIGNRATAQLLASQRQSPPRTSASHLPIQRTAEQHTAPAIQTRQSSIPVIQRAKTKNNKTKNSKTRDI